MTMARRFAAFGGLRRAGLRSPVGGVAWTPSQLSNLYAWYRADDVVLSGSSITTLTDKSGNGHHLVQGTASARPTQVDREGQKAASFDGGDLMKVAFGANLAQPSERYVVAEITDFAADRYIFDSDAGTNRNLLVCDSTGPGRTDIYAGTLLSAGNATAATIQAFGTRFDGAASKIWLNDFRAGSETTGNAGAQAASGITLGASFTPNLNLLGFVWELIVLSAPASDSERAQIGDYSTARYDSLTVVT